MACDTPLLLFRKGDIHKGKVYNEDVEVPCGKCPPCKLRRVNEWVFRLRQEELVSSSSYFVTLTYNTDTVPISNNGFMTLNRQDWQKFMKRLRKKQTTKIRYYMCGEYGDLKERPHYHAIMFNIEDIEAINIAWNKGDIHIGTVTAESIAYTAKYIDKQKKIPKHRNDDRIREFSLMSKGLGKSFLSKSMIKYYQNDITRLHVTKEGGQKMALPRYYRKQIFTEEQQKQQHSYIKKVIKDKIILDEKTHKELYGDAMDYTEWKQNQKLGRYHKFYSPNKKVRT